MLMQNEEEKKHRLLSGKWLFFSFFGSRPGAGPHGDQPTFRRGEGGRSWGGRPRREDGLTARLHAGRWRDSLPPSPGEGLPR